MEHCIISNSKHQTGAPPRGWGLRRRNLRRSGVIQLPGVRFQEKDTKKLKPVGAKRKSRLKRSDSGKHCNLKPSI